MTATEVLLRREIQNAEMKINRIQTENEQLKKENKKLLAGIKKAIDFLSGGG